MKNSLDFWRNNSWAPAPELSTLHRGIDRLFDDILSTDRQQWSFSPACDVEESENHYMLSFDLPGISKEDVKIQVFDNQLIVSGERKEEHRNEQKSRYVSERVYGSFQRIFSLPRAVDADKVEANFSDGVLTVSVPKAESAKPRQIKIAEGKPSSTAKMIKDEGQTEQEKRSGQNRVA